MMIRTSETTVTFRRPFAMPGMADVQPAGTYKLVMDDLEIDDGDAEFRDASRGIFIVRKRLATHMLLPALSIFKTDRRSVDIKAAELVVALEADRQAASFCVTSKSAVSS